MRKFYTILIISLFFANALNAQSSTVVINEVYGGGGNSGATYKNDFIELYNRGNEAVNLTGWSVQYASATGSSWQRTNLSGTISAGGYYLIQQAQGAGGTLDLPTPDASGTITMGATAGKVVLLRTTTIIPAGTICPSSSEVVDIVGFGNANCSETAPTPALSNTTSVTRSPSHEDTNNNSSDFTVGGPSPTNANPAKAISITASGDASEPSSNGSFTISFSPATTAATSFDYTIGAGSATFGSDYTVSVNNGGNPSALTNVSGTINIPLGVASVVVSIKPINDLASEDKETISFSIANPAGGYTLRTSTATINLSDDDVSVTKINVIQGAGTSASPGTYAVEGIVTAVYPNWSPAGYYVQEEDSDKDDNLNTSEGIFIVQANPSVNVGDNVRVTGVVQENSASPSFGQAVLTSSSFSVLSSGNSLPAATTFALPVDTDADLEKYEGMLVQYTGTLTVTDNSELGNRGSLRLSAGGLVYQPTQIIDPNDATPSGVSIVGNSNVSAIRADSLSSANRSIILDDGSNTIPQTLPYVNSENTNRVGTTVDGLTGIMGFGFSSYRIQPVNHAAPTFTFASRPMLPTLAGNLKIASFNVLNYFNGDGTGGGFPTSRGANSLAEFNRQRDKIISALSEMNADIVGLLEIENDGTGPTSAIQDLVNGLNAKLGAGTYSFVQDGATSQSYNTDEIRAGIIYKPAVVLPVGTALTSNDEVFDRPPLAQTFKLTTVQKTFTYIINHFKSKGSCPSPNTAPNPNLNANDGQGCWNDRRKLQAEALVNFINSVIVPTTGNDRVITMGDYNAYYEEDPMDVFRANGLIVLGSGTSYSYLFDGQLGSLDHAVVTASMNALLTGFAKWNINSVEPTYLDYNDNLRDAGESNSEVNSWAATYTPSPWRSSDHDAVIASFSISKTTDISILKSAPTTVKTGESLNYTIIVRNAGPDEADNVVLSDILPQGTTYVSLTVPYAWTLTVPNVGEGGTVKSSINTLPSGIDQVFTLVVKLACDIDAASITNSASVSGDSDDLNSDNNTSSTSTAVQVSKPIVSIPDAAVLPAGVQPNTVYIGYSPASSIQLTSAVAGGAEPYTYVWSDGSTTANITVSPTTATNYTLTVTDKNGCTITTTKYVDVVDVRAGKAGTKVLICHNGSKTLEVGNEGVEDHLAHGDMLGTCFQKENQKNSSVFNLKGKLSVVSFPNPSSNFFTIRLEGGKSLKYILIVKDAMGKVIERREGLKPNQSLEIGHDYQAGFYFIELSGGEEKVTLKLIKF